MLTQPVINSLLSDSAAKIVFDNRRCLRSRFNGNSCKGCLDVCRSNALKLHGRQVFFDAEKCTSCMQCTSVCPNDAFAHTTDFLPLLQTLADKQTVSISCQKGVRNHITVPCIGLFSEPLLWAINSVAKGNCFIDVSHCDECANSHCAQTLHEQLQKITNKTMGRGKIRLRCQVDKQSDYPADEISERRSFLWFIGKTIIDMGKETVFTKPVVSDRTKNQQRKNKTKNTSALHYAFSITPEERIYDREKLLSYFFSVSTNKQCDCCPSCAGMCPTGALKRKKDNEKKYLTFTSARCSGCGLCVHFCRKSALTLKRGFSGDPNGFLQLAP